jgi:protein kinase-like protein/BACON domain-containing protein
MSELLNQTIGGYQLVEHIGGGGVAQVYRGRQASGGAREVAVKVIYPEFARQPGIAANFAQIARAAGQLANHPHILPVIGSGEEHEYLYLVTPLVKEGTLATWMQRGGRLGVSDVGPFFQQLCGAVSYAHSLGLTHGNIRPSNVYLFEGRHVLLGDFGLLWDVRVLDPSWSGPDVAAFEFLAPEVFDGQVTPASDIYSLGATLFATLTGHAPFRAGRLGDLIAAVRQQTPPSLGQETPPLAPQIVALDAAVRQAMAKQMEQRYPAAGMVAQAIETTLRQAPASVGLGQPAAPAPGGLGQPPAGPTGPGAPLTQLDPPFPPLPPMAPPGVAMEMGGIGLAASAAGAPPFAAPPTQRVDLPSSVDGPTMQVAAPQLDPMSMSLGPEHGPPTPRRLASPSGRVDAPPPPDEEMGAKSSQFSATELGLPRLTNPAMGNLPPDWQELVSDASARKRHDPFEMGESALAPLPPMDPFEASQDDFGASRDDQNQNGGAPSYGGAERDAWAASAWEGAEPRQPWEPSDEESAQFGAVRGAHADYDINQMAGERPPLRRGGRFVEPEEDTLQGQKIWTNSHTIVRGKRRPKAPFITILALLALAALELAGLAVVRPDICVTHACSVVSGYARRMAPGLRIPGITAPVQLSPVVPQISVATEGSSQAKIMLLNTSADPITWSATPSLTWMSVSPTQGALKGGASQPLTISVKPHGVAPGTYTGALVVSVGDGASAEPVVVTIKPGAELAVTQSALAFTQCGAAQTLSLHDTGGSKLTFTASPSEANALSVSPGSGVVAPGGTMSVAVTMTCDGATSGRSYAVIIVSNGGSAQVPISYK